MLDKNLSHQHGLPRPPKCYRLSILSLCIQSKIYKKGNSKVKIKESTVDPVIKDHVIKDFLSPTIFFSCMYHFSIADELWSTTFCPTRLATSNKWQKVIILLVSNFIIQLLETLMRKWLHVISGCGYNGYNGISLGDHCCCPNIRPIYLRPLLLPSSNITVCYRSFWHYHSELHVGNHSTLYVQWSTKDMSYESI